MHGLCLSSQDTLQSSFLGPDPEQWSQRRGWGGWQGACSKPTAGAPEVPESLVFAAVRASGSQ